MKPKSKRKLRWVRLDNAAKIYPAARRRNWSSIYRLSATLTERVDTGYLHDALTVIVRRFPSIAARLQKGLFWYYLQQVEATPAIIPEYSYPLTYMSRKEMRKCAFRVIVYDRRIAVEFFHSLTDGAGAMIFFKNLIAEYLERKHGVRFPLTHGLLDRKEPPREEELTDCFPKYAGPVPATRRDTNAWRIRGELSENSFLTHTVFRLPVGEALAAARRYQTTLTVFLSALMMKALLELQKEKQPEERRRQRVKLQIPINLRALFESQTLRNFSMYTVAEADPRLGEYTLAELVEIVRHKMGTDFTKKHMAAVIATNVNDEKNPLIRLIPLPIKNAVMKLIFNSVGEKKSCMSFSNLGKVELPEEMKPFIESFGIVPVAGADTPYAAGMISYQEELQVSFIRKLKHAELERHFYAALREEGLIPTLQSNQNER